MSRHGFISINIDGIDWLFQGKTVSYPEAPDKFPACAHCKSKITTLIREDRQYGFDRDKYRLILYCEECSCVTIAEYQINHERSW